MKEPVEQDVKRSMHALMNEVREPRKLSFEEMRALGGYTYGQGSFAFEDGPYTFWESHARRMRIPRHIALMVKHGTVTPMHGDAAGIFEIELARAR